MEGIDSRDERGRRAGGLERINAPGAATLLFLSESPTLSSLIWFELNFCHAFPRTMTQYLLSLSLSYLSLKEKSKGWEWRCKQLSLSVPSSASWGQNVPVRPLHHSGSSEDKGPQAPRVLWKMSTQWQHQRSMGACQERAREALLTFSGQWLHFASQETPKHLCRMRMESRVTILN